MSERAVSTTLSYVLTLAISSLLVTGLIVAGGTYVSNEREQVVRDELTVIGQQLASDVERADRLVQAGESGTVDLRLNQTFANRVTGTTYRISFQTSPKAVVVESVDPEISVSVEVNIETALSATNVDGGPVQIHYSGSALEVRDV